MSLKESIENRVNDLKNVGFDRRAIEKELGYAEFYVDQIISKGGNKKFLAALDRLYVEKSNNQKDYLEKRRQLKQESAKKIPLYDAPVKAGGDLYYSEMTPISAPAGTIDIGDLLNDSECALRVYGNSMIPNYPPGCVVGLVKCTKSFIEPGEVYVIETEDRRVIKRLFYKDDDPDTNIFTCYSDNILKFDGGARHGKPAYPIFNLPIEEVKSIYQVTGVIKRNSNSIIIR